jgi:hypothetical protein
MPDPSACGFPDVETVGVQPGVSLAAVSGSVTLNTPGMVYENKLVTGSIAITAPNVTIRNVRLINTDPAYAIKTQPWSNTVKGTVLDHVEINLSGQTDMKAIAFNEYTARHVFFTNGNDCAHMGDNVVIEDSLCVVGPDANRDGKPDGNSQCNGPEHFDGFQSDGGHNITLRHNTILNPCDQTSAILLSSNTEPISDVRVENNLMAGGGYTLYCAGDDRPDRVTNITVTGNRFARTYSPRSGYWGPTGYCGPGFADIFNANVWDNTNTPLDGTKPGSGTDTADPAAVLGSRKPGNAVASARAGTAHLYRVRSNARRPINTLSIYLDSSSALVESSRLKLGLYTDKSGRPRKLLAQCSVAAPVADAWNRCSIKVVKVKPGRQYWTAMLQPRRSGGTIRYRMNAGRGRSVTSRAGHLARLPRTWRSSRRSNRATASIYASYTSRATGG